MNRKRFVKQRHAQRFRAWLQQYHNPAMVQQAGSQRVCRDMVTLLTYVQNHKVVGTQSTGNMPLKAVREVTADFVNPPQLDTTIGERTYRLRSEADVWPLYFLHILAEVGGLLSCAPSRRWRLTDDGLAFLKRDAFLQLGQLLTVWWYGVNWLVAYPFEGMGEALPVTFRMTTLRHLQRCDEGQRIAFEAFADDLIAETGLTWTAIDSRSSQMSLRSGINQMVIKVLADFGAVDCQTREEPLGKGTIKKLDTFWITPLGQALLAGIAAMRD